MRIHALFVGIASSNSDQMDVSDVGVLPKVAALTWAVDSDTICPWQAKRIRNC